MSRETRVLACPSCGEDKPITIAVIEDGMGVEHLGPIGKCDDCARAELAARGREARGDV